MKQPTSTIRCNVGALVVADHTLTHGDNVLPTDVADAVLTSGSHAFDSGLLEVVGGSPVAVRVVPDVSVMTVRDVRDGVASDAWTADELRAMLDAERNGSARKGVVARLTDAIAAHERIGGPVVVVEG